MRGEAGAANVGDAMENAARRAMRGVVGVEGRMMSVVGMSRVGEGCWVE